MKVYRSIFVIIVLFLKLIIFNGCKQSTGNNGFESALEVDQDTTEINVFSGDGDENFNNVEIPSYVIEILTYIRTNNKAPQNYEGGRIFYNREKRLPLLNKHREANYREWDVHRKVKGRNRGPERLITSESSAYYTKDHYKTFIFIKETH